MNSTRYRPVAWLFCLTIAIACALRLSHVPTLNSEPELRVGLYLGLFFTHIGLVFLWPFRKYQTLWIFTTALILRACLISAPVSDDVHRYLWEGKLINQGINPYTDIADAEVFAPYRDDQWDKMNHKERLTAYPPGIQLIFAAIGAISYDPVAFKITFILADLLTLLFLIKLLKARAQPLRLAGFYAFSPIVLLSTAAEAHYDSFFILGLVGFWLAAEVKKPWLAWLSLAFAVHVKIVCVILAPLYFNRQTWRSSWIFPALIFGLALPFSDQLSQLAQGVFGFATGGQFNGFFHSIIMHLSSAETANTAVGILFAALGLTLWVLRLRGLPLIHTCAWVLCGLILFSPIIHFWYLLWILPLFALRSSLSWIVLSGSIGLYFMVWSRQPWGLTHWEHAAIWIPFALVGAAELPRAIRRVWNARHYPAPQTTAVIIPTLNAAASLQTALDSIPAIDEIIIADGGSTDETLSIALAHGAHAVSTPPGRGAQIAHGISKTKSDLIIVLHADATLPDGAVDRAHDYFLKDPTAGHAVLGQRFDSKGAGPLGLIVEILNEMRVVLNGTSFGDQVQIFHRRALESAGGFPTQPLMEDVEASLRTMPLSITGYLGHECTVSGEKWRGGNSQKRFALVIELVVRYRITRWRSKEKAAQLTELLYQKYYG